MRFICLGFHGEPDVNALSETERNSFMERCFAYDDVLRKGGHFINGIALQPPGDAVTVRSRSGQPVAVDGPYAETKERLGGIMFLEARDMKHAVELMSKHPGLRAGGFEIRPVHEEITGMIAARQQRETK